MTKNYLLAAILLTATSVTWGQDNADLAQSVENAKKIARGAKQTVPAQAPRDKWVDIVAGALQDCSFDERRAFLLSLKFNGEKVASFNMQPIEQCAKATKLDDLLRRFEGSLKINEDTRNGDCESRGICRTNFAGTCTKNCNSDGKDAGEIEPLFPACSADVRKEFFDRMEFRGGKIVTIYTGSIKKCSTPKDLQRFNALFGDEKGIHIMKWLDDNKCNKPGHCTPSINLSCNLETC